MALICDTGPLYAAMDRADADHRACAELLAGSVEQLLVPAPVIVELEWLASSRLGPEHSPHFWPTWRTARSLSSISSATGLDELAAASARDCAGGDYRGDAAAQGFASLAVVVRRVRAIFPGWHGSIAPDPVG